MRTVDITTTQKVTIRYELASIRDRIVGWIIDIVIAVAAVLLLEAFIGFGERSARWVALLFFFVPLLTHNLIFEIAMNGQTIGKKAMGVRVVKLDGKQPSIADFVVRWAFRLVDIGLSVGSVATVLISSSNKSQRLGDMLANTAVIKLTPSHSVYLNDLLKIQSAEDYKPRYDSVRSFTESEMLLIKEALDRHSQFPNQAHQTAVSTLAAKASTRLGLNGAPQDEAAFLKTLLRDYVVLTR